jgi:flap endonuclease-1
MGIKNLNTLIESNSLNGINKKHLSAFSGKILAIDTNVYLYKYLYGKSNHIDGMFFMINKFKKFDITPIFILDGKPPDEKFDTIKNRRIIKDRLEEKLSLLKIEIKALEIDTEIHEIQKEIDIIEKKIIYVNRNVIDKTKTLFDLMGVVYIEADCEAEHYCSKLCNLDIVDGVVSEDMDTIACGSKLVIRNFTNRDDNVESYYLQEILYDIGLTYKSFVDLCILLGNDYNHRPRGLSPHDVYDIIKEYGSIENMHKNDVLTNWNCNFNRIRSIIALDNIFIDRTELTRQFNKKPNITMLKTFLRTSSTIDEKTYLHRINLIYFQHKKTEWNVKKLFRPEAEYKLSRINKKYNNYTINNMFIPSMNF